MLTVNMFSQLIQWYAGEEFQDVSFYPLVLYMCHGIF